MIVNTWHLTENCDYQAVTLEVGKRKERIGVQITLEMW